MLVGGVASSPVPLDVFVRERGLELTSIRLSRGRGPWLRRGPGTGRLVLHAPSVRKRARYRGPGGVRPAQHRQCSAESAAPAQSGGALVRLARRRCRHSMATDPTSPRIGCGLRSLSCRHDNGPCLCCATTSVTAIARSHHCSAAGKARSAASPLGVQVAASPGPAAHRDERGGAVTTRLEDELTRLLITRAELIETAPAYRLAPDAEDDRLLEHPVPRSDRRWSRLPVLVAVAAVAAVLATLLGIYFATVRPARSSKPADGSSCDLAGSARFAAALRDGQLPSAAVVLSGAADGACSSRSCTAMRQQRSSRSTRRRGAAPWAAAPERVQ